GQEGLPILVDVLSLPANLALIAAVQAAENAQQSGLAAAIAALHLHHIPRLHLKIQVAEQNPLVPLAEQRAGLQQRRLTEIRSGGHHGSLVNDQYMAERSGGSITDNGQENRKAKPWGGGLAD